MQLKVSNKRILHQLNLRDALLHCAFWFGYSEIVSSFRNCTQKSQLQK